MESADKKLRRVLLLMTVSGILLSLFIARWLRSEYNNESSELNGRLFEQFMDARARVTDTLLSRNLIDPMLRDPNGFKMRVHNPGGIPVPGDSIRVVINNVEYDTMSADLRIPGPDLAEYDTVTINNFGPDSNVLFSGVKLFLSKMDPNGTEHDIVERYIAPGDSNLLKAYYQENIDREKIPVHLKWVSDKKIDHFPPPPFYYESHISDRPFAVEIQHTGDYLFRQILPESIFSVILLLLVTAAFIFSYRSIVSQRRLTIMKDDFISNISHELKTPVATVKVALEAIQQMDPEEKKDKIRDYMQIARQEMNRLEILVNNVMNSITHEHGKNFYSASAVNVNDMVKETISAMELNLRQKDGKVIFNEGDAPHFIQADPLHIKGVFFNLLDNSIKYGNAPAEIRISIHHENGFVVVEFSDNGPGIPEAYIQKIFDKFFRVPTGNEHSVKGYGLGLFYVAEVVQASGGVIRVKNNSGPGCTFTLQFPTV